jgi:hypothetical protein
MCEQSIYRVPDLVCDLLDALLDNCLPGVVGQRGTVVLEMVGLGGEERCRTDAQAAFLLVTADDILTLSELLDAAIPLVRRRWPDHSTCVNKESMGFVQ